MLSVDACFRTQVWKSSSISRRVVSLSLARSADLIQRCAKLICVVAQERSTKVHVRGCLRRPETLFGRQECSPVPVRACQLKVASLGSLIPILALDALFGQLVKLTAKSAQGLWRLNPIRGSYIGAVCLANKMRSSVSLLDGFSLWEIPDTLDATAFLSSFWDALDSAPLSRAHPCIRYSVSAPREFSQGGPSHERKHQAASSPSDSR